MQMLAVLAFVTFMGMSATAQSYLPPDQAVTKIDATLPGLINPTPPASNGTLQLPVSAAGQKVTPAGTLAMIKIDYLIDVKRQLKEGQSTGAAIENTKTWLTAQLNGRPTTTLDQAYNYVKTLLLQ